MKRIMVAVVGGLLLLSVVGCTKTVYVTTTEAPVTTDAPTTDVSPTEAPAPIYVGTPADPFRDSRVEKACGLVRNLQPPNGNNSDADLVYLTDLAEALSNQISIDEQAGLGESRYEMFAEALKGTTAYFERDYDRHPSTRILVLGQCDDFGW
jgi:hypothetical protein